MFRVTRRYQFSASHRLHAAPLSEEENQRLYGKCNNPFGHGHNYVVEVSARGPLDEATGRAMDTAVLDRLVAREVLGPFEHSNLNTDVKSFEQVVPTSENLAEEILRRLQDAWSSAFPGEWPKLEKVRIAETARNIFEVETDEIAQSSR
jgi:6-pyruvoyltetrahydropterin/6-carboxytetrahydropterin synthase